jgi:hypothetical protein
MPVEHSLGKLNPKYIQPCYLQLRAPSSLFYMCANKNVEIYRLNHAHYLSRPPSRVVDPEGKCKGDDVSVHNVKSYGK